MYVPNNNLIYIYIGGFWFKKYNFLSPQKSHWIWYKKNQLLESIVVFKYLTIL